MYPFIVADVGGTNARFALVTDKLDGEFQLKCTRIYKGSEFANFDLVMEDYLAQLDGVKPHAACVAIAGPIDGDAVKMTNLPWHFSQRELKQRFDLQAFNAINDFTAMAMASSILKGESLNYVLPGSRQKHGNKAICGAGTGLGVAGLCHDGRYWLPIPSEGGHVTLGPATIEEAELLKLMLRQHAYVSAEMCLSGPGLINLYKAFAELEGQSAEALAAHEISQRGLDNSDVLCRKALDQFCAFMGTVASNLALTYGAKGGVYLCGGIVPRFVDYLRKSLFKERFLNKGVMSHYLADIPVDVMVHELPAFHGAAAWMEQTLNSQ
ncbi:glucokinase [Agaribacterium haliotis]|uniref:glucokinase n=1 Tax=Agaribacterium haliotis TaxID=2013869 RepID=UPI000BB55A7C|nr:glucokinase [Agaribacterium haliotis]